MIYFSIFGFYDLNLVENDTNIITLLHLHQKISRLTNNGKQCILTTVMYIWRHDICHVTALRWCHICQNVSPIPSNKYDEAISAVGIIKKVTGENVRGVVPTPLGVRGLIIFACSFFHISLDLWYIWYNFKLFLIMIDRLSLNYCVYYNIYFQSLIIFDCMPMFSLNVIVKYMCNKW